MNFVSDDSIAADLAANTFTGWSYLVGNGHISGFASVSGNKLRLTGGGNGYLYRSIVRARAYGNYRVVISLSAGEINTGGDLFYNHTANGGQDQIVLQVTTAGQTNWYAQDVTLPSSPGQGNVAASINGTDPFKIEIVKTGNFPFTLVAKVYNVAAGDIGAGATLVATNTFGGSLFRFGNYAGFQGPAMVGLNAPNSGTKVISGFEVFDDVDAQTPYPKITQNDGVQATFTPLWGRSGARGVTAVQYRLHRQAGSGTFVPSGATAVTGYTSVASLTDATGVADTAYSYIVEMFDGTTSVYAPFVATTTKRSSLTVFWWGHSYIQGGTTYGQTSTAVGVVQKTTDALSQGRLTGVARTVASINKGVGGSQTYEWAAGKTYLATSIQDAIAFGCNAAIGMLYTNDGNSAQATTAAYMKTLTDTIKAIPQFAWNVVLAAPGTGNVNFTRAAAQGYHTTTKALVHDGRRVFCLGAEIIEMVAKNTAPAGATNPTPLYTAGAANASTTSWFFTDFLHYNDLGVEFQAAVAAGAVLEAEKAVAILASLGYPSPNAVLSTATTDGVTPGNVTLPATGNVSATAPAYGSTSAPQKGTALLGPSRTVVGNRLPAGSGRQIVT